MSEDGLSWLEMLLTSLRASEVGVTMSIREGRGGEGGEERGGKKEEDRNGKRRGNGGKCLY